MATQPRFSRTTLPARAAAYALLAILGSSSGAFSQAPATPVPAQPPAVPAPKPAAPGAPVAATDPVKLATPTTADSTQDAMQIVDLLASLAHYDQDGRTQEQKIGFELPERAVNEYLAFSLRNRPRPGIGSATVTLLSGNNVQLVVEIDFSAIQSWTPDLLPEALRPLLTGKRTVKVNAHFESRNGTLTLALKDVTGPDGKPFAGKVITDLLQSIATRQPEAYDPATPFPLPFGLKRVWTEKQSLLGET
jgi:hypothetical protein